MVKLKRKEKFVNRELKLAQVTLEEYRDEVQYRDGSEEGQDKGGTEPGRTHPIKVISSTV